MWSLTYKGSLLFHKGPLKGLQLTFQDEEVEDEADEFSPIKCLVEDPPLEEDILGDLCLGEDDGVIALLLLLDGIVNGSWGWGGGIGGGWGCGCGSVSSEDSWNCKMINFIDVLQTDN